MGKKAFKAYAKNIRKIVKTVKAVASLCTPDNCLKVDVSQEPGCSVIVRAEYLVDPAELDEVGKVFK